MDSERIASWQQADRLFTQWLDLAPAARKDWLAGLPEAEGTRVALMRLIAQHQDSKGSSSLLPGMAEFAAPVTPGTNALQGRQIGDWTLIEEIGRGGMSVVYKARRSMDQFEQFAAVKLLGLAALGSQGGMRFERERRMLARLQHPHIATLIDGGLAEDGTPYLVMPLVAGKDLASHCKEHELDWSQRVRLLVEVCAAVAHAHQNLLVHRDLKPANILVSDEGVATLLDFGIAKLLDVDEEATQTGFRAMTPSYAAPEQMSGDTITTATDVYALGMILRELCADLASIPNDLRNIIAMATRAEPDRRYPDARALAEDLKRLLSGNVVLATPDSLGYRLQSFMRRRRGAVLASAMVLLALVGGLVTTQWQARRAETQAREALRQSGRAEAAREFLFDLFEAGNRDRTGGEDPLVSTLVERGAQSLPQLLQRPELHAEMSTLLARIDIAIGRHERAGKLLEGASTSAARAQDPVLEAQVELAQANLANATGDSARALDLYEHALSRREQAAGPDFGFRTSVLSGWVYAMKNQGRQTAARQRIERELADPVNDYSADQRGQLLLSQALVTTDMRQRLKLARAAEDAFSGQPTSAANQLALEVELGQDLFETGQRSAGIEHMRRVVDMADRLYPGATRYRARTYNDLAAMLRADDKLGQANAAGATAESIYRQLGDDRSPAFAALIHNRGLLLHDLGDSAQGLPLLEQALSIAQSQFGNEDRRTGLARRHLALLRALTTGDPAADREWARARTETWSAFRPREQVDTMLIGAQIALVLDRPEAKSRLLEADKLAASGQVALSDSQKVRRQTMWGIMHSLDGNATAAGQAFAAALQVANARSGKAHSRLWQIEKALGEHFLRYKQPELARAHFQLSLDALRQLGAAPQASGVVALQRQLASLQPLAASISEPSGVRAR